MSVRLKYGKTVNVRGSDLLFEGNAAAVEVEGQWMLARVLGSRMEGCVMRQHDDGSSWVCCFKGRTRAATGHMSHRALLWCARAV